MVFFSSSNGDYLFKLKTLVTYKLFSSFDWKGCKIQQSDKGNNNHIDDASANRLQLTPSFKESLTLGYTVF